VVLQWWNSLQQLSMTNRVGLFWVPGHCDILGNEKADELAKRGSGSSFCGADLRHLVEISGSRQSKQLVAAPKLGVTKYLLSMSKNKLRI
jgi:RNase H